jgi:hypothetical protein
MSPRVGIIEWVQNSRTLKDVIVGQLPEHKKDVSSEAHSMHQAWIERLVGAEGRSRPYPSMMCKATSEGVRACACVYVCVCMWSLEQE